MKLFLYVISLGLALPAAFTAAFLLLFSLTPPPTPITSSGLNHSSTVLGASIILEPQYTPTPSFTNIIQTADARPKIIADYLTRYKSDLEPFSQNIVDISDKYALDYRLLVAIAQQESNLCKRIPLGSHNCWGFGIYGNKVTRFDSYPQALETVAKTLKKDYVDRGLDTPEEIMRKYTPPSEGSWAAGVSQFLTELQ